MINLYERSPPPPEPYQANGKKQGPAQPPPLTRSGYVAGEAFRCYEIALGETGPIASGKALHFAADLVCSGGLDLWIRAAYSYASQHIGISSPRIFVYLRQKIAELDKKAAMLPTERFYSDTQIQEAISEVVLVLQMCPKRAKLVWPSIPEEAKTGGEAWLRTVTQAGETRAVTRVFSNEGDKQALLWVGCELCKAITEGNSERALFWIRWVLEEDARLRKESKGTGLTRVERGSSALSSKTRTEAGHFLCSLLAEVYKEFAARGMIRMHEEFQEFIFLWRGGESRLPSRLRRECLGWMAMICCEVPRWKVPAAPVLIQDSVKLSRAVGQCGQFFREILSFPALAAGKSLKISLAKAREGRKASEKEGKMDSLESHLDAYDSMIEAYLNK